MKSIIKLFVMSVVLLACGCSTDDENKHHFDNKLFVDVQSPIEQLMFRSGENAVSASRQLVVGMAMPEQSEVRGVFKKNTQLVSTYNLAYGKEALPLPEDMCVIDEPTAIIAPGSIKSQAITINFVRLEKLDEDLLYVMPIELTNVEGTNVLSSKTVTYFVFKGESLINVVASMSGNRIWPEWQNAGAVTNMSKFTLEALVYGNAFDKEISTIMGIENIFLVRIGDATIPKNQIQIASTDDKGGDEKLTSSDLKLEPNRWYHVAVTFDKGNVIVYLNGKAKATKKFYRTKINFGVAHSDEMDGKERCFWIGYSYNNDRGLDGYISEVRIWNKVLSEEEINAENHFYFVSPDTEGLAAYWKFNDGMVGKVVKDYTANGNDLTAETNLSWVNVELPEKK